MTMQHVGLVGYGEVGRIFSAGLLPQVASVRAWDLKFIAEPSVREAPCGHARAAGVDVCESMTQVCDGVDLLISAVTASHTLEVAQAAAAHLRPGTVFLDMNSASPGTKQQAAALIDAAGGHYVEAGVMTSVPPYGLRVPMLLGGAYAAVLTPVLAAWGMDATVVSDRLGVASAIKMCRSVMIKGLEALVIESYTTARAYGVEDHMIPTLQETFPGIDWQKTGAYFFSRVVQHGQRRAEEMRESANTVRETGFEPFMTAAIADKQQWVADQARTGVFEGVDTNGPWQPYADKLIARRKD
jgi:3-hydroxyisobutyrate dehydrogenase-like beta-hydroxyacid dehydrogenase